MTLIPPRKRKRVLDKDLDKIVALEAGGHRGAVRLLPVGLSVVFLAVAWMLAAGRDVEGAGAGLIVVATVIGGYMALNIGANDVANNMAPAVGARALTMGGALVIAAICEAAGALLAGGDVVATISSGIIAPTSVADRSVFIAVMMAALLGAALWLNLATWIEAPVSTTHAIVGSVLGAGVAAAGLDAANWPVLAAIVGSWVVSPLLGAGIAALMLAVLDALILQADDRVAAARRWVPLVVAVTAAAFAAYLLTKGLSQVWTPSLPVALVLAAAVFAAAYELTRRLTARRAPLLDNSKKAVGALFTAPLIVAAALLSFAHGANDVANAIGPLAAIVAAVGGSSDPEVAVPGWIMAIGAFGIATGLALFGPRLIRMVGEKITRLNPVRAFCVAISAALTVLAASALGLPVSSTHIAVGAVFGVGLARERHARRGGHIRRQARLNEARLDQAPLDQAPLDQTRGQQAGLEATGLEQAKRAAAAEIEALLPDPGNGRDDGAARTSERALRKAAKRRLVRRQHLLTIAAAWLVTVPLSALLGAALFAIIVRLIPAL